MLSKILCYKMCSSMANPGVADKDPALFRVVAMTVTSSAMGSQMIQHASQDIMKRALVQFPPAFARLMV